jgi:hypothetical protein
MNNRSLIVVLWVFVIGPIALFLGYKLIRSENWLFVLLVLIPAALSFLALWLISRLQAKHLGRSSESSGTK